MQFFIVSPKIYQSHALLFHQLFYRRIVVTFILTTNNQYGRRFHALQRIPAGVYISGLRVIDVLHATHFKHFFEPVLYAGKIAKTLSDNLFLYARNVCGNSCCQRVINIMLTGKTQRFLFHIKRRGLFYLILSLFDIGDASFLFQFREGELKGVDIIFFQLVLNDRVVIPKDKAIGGSLVL